METLLAQLNFWLTLSSVREPSKLKMGPRCGFKETSPKDVYFHPQNSNTTISSLESTTYSASISCQKLSTW